MKILHIVNDHVTGGVRTLVLELALYQKRKGNDVTILSLLDSPHIAEESEMLKREKGIYLHMIGRQCLYNPLKILTLSREMKKYDVVHVHQFPNQFFSKIAYTLLDKKKRPYFITTEHSTFNNRRKYNLLRPFDRWFYKTYNKIVCISKAAEINLKEWLKSNKLDEKIITITNGVNILKYKDAVNKLPKVIDYDDAKKYIVMVARMAYPKDPRTLVRSLKYCPQNVDLIFIGDGELNQSINDEATVMNMENRIHILGNRNNVPQLLKGGHIGVLSTKWDGFGLVAVEYMAAGLPVIVSDVDGLRDVVGDKDALFHYGDEKDLGKKISRLVEDEDYYKEKKNYSENRCKLFSVDKMNEEYMKVYNLGHESV